MNKGESQPMYCSQCGAHNQDGAHFCQNCGAPLQAPGAVQQHPYIPPYPSNERYSQEAVDEQERPAARRSTRATRAPKPQDPYQEQIKQLKLELKQVKLYLKEINTKMSATRSQYHETSAFVPEGILHRGYKWFEDMRLLGPQQQKQQLQQQIIQMEQQLLGLEQAQNQWKMQNQ
jgi:predicted amidophosphoribosyltransferase